jgi:L1 cell adhesion molecule like protein
MHTLIPRNSTIPTKKTDTFTTYQDNQPSVTIRIYEGERKFVKDNNLLGEFNLDGIPPMRAREPKIEISYDLDANGILTVNAVEKSTGNSKNLVIKSDKGRLSKEEVERKVKDDDANWLIDKIINLSLLQLLKTHKAILLSLLAILISLIR